MKVKNAFDYSQELSELNTILESLSNTLEYVEGAIYNAESSEEDRSMEAMALSLAKTDIKKSQEYISIRRDEIVNKLSGSFF